MEKSKFMMIVIIALLVLMMGTIVTVSLYVLNLVQNQISEVDAEANRNPQAIRRLTVEELSEVAIGDKIQTNLLSGPDGKDRYAVFNLTVSFDNTQKRDSEAIGELLGRNVERIRSVALACARNKTYEDLIAADGHLVLANDIREQLQLVFESTLIYDVVVFELLVS